MEESAILLTLTQVDVAFVGFAGIIAAFQFKDDFKLKKSDVIGLKVIIHTGLLGIFLSLLPLILSSFGLKDSEVWTSCSAIASINFLTVIFYRGKQIKQSKTRKRSSFPIFLFNFSIMILVAIINLLNTFDIVFHREFGPYFISLIVPLGLVGFMFSRLLFLPIMSTINNRE